MIHGDSKENGPLDEKMSTLCRGGGIYDHSS